MIDERRGKTLWPQCRSVVVLFGSQENPFCYVNRRYVMWKGKEGKKTTTDNAFRASKTETSKRIGNFNAKKTFSIQIELNIANFNICIKTFLFNPLSFMNPQFNFIHRKTTWKWLKKIDNVPLLVPFTLYSNPSNCFSRRFDVRKIY